MVAGVDDLVRVVFEVGQQLSLPLDRGQDAARLQQQGMLAPGLLKPINQHRVRRFEEEDRRIQLALAELFQGWLQRCKAGSGAHIDDTRDVGAAAVTQIGKLRQEGRRQIIHAVVAQVLKNTEGLRLSGAGDAGNDYKSHSV